MMTMKSQRLRAVAACVLGSAFFIAGCGSSSSSSSASHSTSAGATTTAAGTALPGIQKAKVEAAALEAIPGKPFTVPPLGKPVPKNLHVAYVTCNLPQCAENALVEPAKILGWTQNTVPYDISKGPTDEIRAMDQAIQDGAKYIVFSSAFDPTAMAGAFALAKSKGVKLAGFGYPGPPKPPIYSSMAGPPYDQLLMRVATIGALADSGKPTVIGYAEDPSIPAYKTVSLAGVQQAVKQYGDGSTIKVANYSSSAPAAQTVAGFVNFLRNNPDVKYFITPSSVAFDGLPQALAQAGLAGSVKLLVAEPQGPDIKEIANGELWGGAAGENHSLLFKASDVFARLAAGVPLGSQAYPAGWARLITKANAADVTGLNATPDGAPVPYNFVNAYKKAWGLG